MPASRSTGDHQVDRGEIPVREDRRRRRTGAGMRAIDPVAPPGRRGCRARARDSSSQRRPRREAPRVRPGPRQPRRERPRRNERRWPRASLAGDPAQHHGSAAEAPAARRRSPRPRSRDHEREAAAGIASSTLGHAAAPGAAGAERAPSRIRRAIPARPSVVGRPCLVDHDAPVVEHDQGGADGRRPGPGQVLGRDDPAPQESGAGRSSLPWTLSGMSGRTSRPRRRRSRGAAPPARSAPSRARRRGRAR